jgi:transcriptional regulator with XRE-family HTH domain
MLGVQVAAWDELEDRVRAFAKANEIGPHELARRLGYDTKSRSWGSNFLSGRKGLPADRLELVAALMNSTIAALFTADETPNPEPQHGAPRSLARQMAWEFRRAAKVARRSMAQAQLRDIAWALEQVSQGTPGNDVDHAPAKRGRGRG